MSADLIARLIGAGTPAALVAEVAMALGRAQGDQDALNARRDRDAQRQREKRERERLSRDVTVRHVTSEDTTDEAPSLDKETLPRPLKEINSIPCDVIAPPREAPVFDPHPLNPFVAAWLGVLRAACAAETKRWRGMPPPPGVTDEQWQGFLDHRKAKRETLTPRAYQLLCGKLAKHADAEWPPGRIIDQIVERTWLSFEPHWLTRSTEIRNGQRPISRQNDTIRDPLVAAAAARVARGNRGGSNPLG